MLLPSTHVFRLLVVWHLGLYYLTIDNALMYAVTSILSIMVLILSCLLATNEKGLILAQFQLQYNV